MATVCRCLFHSVQVHIELQTIDLIVVLRVILIAHFFDIAVVLVLNLIFFHGNFVRFLLVCAFISFHFVALPDHLRILII